MKGGPAVRKRQLFFALRVLQQRPGDLYHLRRKKAPYTEEDDMLRVIAAYNLHFAISLECVRESQFRTDINLGGFQNRSSMFGIL